MRNWRQSSAVDRYEFAWPTCSLTGGADRKPLHKKMLPPSYIRRVVRSSPVLHQRGLSIHQHDVTIRRNHEHTVTQVKFRPDDAFERIQLAALLQDAVTKAEWWK